MERIDENILSKAIEHFGVANQRMVAIEELSELIKALTKDARGYGESKDIIEEIADVLIVLNQLVLIYDIDHLDIDEAIDKKITRLRETLVKLRVEIC